MSKSFLWSATMLALFLQVSVLSLLVGASSIQRDEHSHMHNSESGPLLKLNETEVTLYHSPTPPSYYTIDWEGADASHHPHPGLIMTHALLMSLAFFVALPAGEIRNFSAM